jgi:hypothetical protein
MKILNAIRSEMYPIIGTAFQELNINPSVIEIGVCKGVNLKNILSSMNSKSSVLIDQWIPYSPFKDAPSGSDLYKAGSKYFGGPVDNPETYENLFKYCQAEFPNSLILRKDSMSAAADLKEKNIKFDFIYIDGGHLYEEVYADLIAYESILSENGILMLDDFINSEEGKMQNLGVVQAVLDFLKNNKNYQPSFITRSTDRAWCNIALTKKDSKINHLIEKNLLLSRIFFVEISDNLLHLVDNSPKNNCLKFYE